jgi:hypothetical protein
MKYVVLLLLFIPFNCFNTGIKYFKEENVRYFYDYHLIILVNAIKKREGFKNKFYIQDNRKTIGYGFQYKNKWIKENQPVEYYDSILVNHYLKIFSKEFDNSNLKPSFKYKMVFVSYVSGKTIKDVRKGLQQFNELKLHRYY